MNRSVSRTTYRSLASVAGVGLVLTLTTGPAFAEPNVCVSTNGSQRVDKGGSDCSSVEGTGNVAIARNGGIATAGIVDGDDHDRARASGNSEAFAGFGD